MAACLEAGEAGEAAYGADDGAVGPEFFEVGVEADVGEGGEVGMGAGVVEDGSIGVGFGLGFGFRFAFGE